MSAMKMSLVVIGNWCSEIGNWCDSPMTGRFD
jgi:hypothetical protein